MNTRTLGTPKVLDTYHDFMFMVHDVEPENLLVITTPSTWMHT